MRIRRPMASLILAALLSSCALPEARVPAGTSRIGLVLPEPSNELCYHYRGFMVWQNQLKRYDLPDNFNQQLLKAISEELGAQGFETIPINPTEFAVDDSVWINQSEWDGTSKIAPASLSRFQAIAAENGTGAILVHSRAIEHRDDPPACPGAIHVYTLQDGPVTIGIGEFYLFDAAGVYRTRFFVDLPAADAGLAPAPTDFDASAIQLATEAVLKQARTKFAQIRAGD